MLWNLFLKRSDKLAILQKSERVYALASSSGSPIWQIQYLILGTHGNFFLGEARGWEHWKEFFISKGGVAYVLPTHKTKDKAADLKLFQKFGAKWIVPPESNWYEHVPDIHELTADLEIMHMHVHKESIYWQLRLGMKSYEVQLPDGQSPLNECIETLPLTFEGNILKHKHQSTTYKNF